MDFAQSSQLRDTICKNWQFFFLGWALKFYMWRFLFLSFQDLDEQLQIQGTPSSLRVLQKFIEQQKRLNGGKIVLDWHPFPIPKNMLFPPPPLHMYWWSTRHVFCDKYTLYPCNKCAFILLWNAIKSVIHKCNLGLRGAGMPGITA